MADEKNKLNQGMPLQATFLDVMQAAALGIAPQAPRVSDGVLQNANMFGGYAKSLTSKNSIPFTELRQIADVSPLLSAIISTRQHQRARYCRLATSSNRGEVGFRVVHRRESDKNFKVPEGFKELCRRVEDMILNPWILVNHDGDIYREIEPSFSSLSSKILTDLLTINRPVIELGLGPNGKPVAFGALDGANVIPTFKALKQIASLEKRPPKDFMSNYAGYKNFIQKVSDKYKVDLDENTEYIYFDNGRPVAGFRYNELIIAPMFPTTDSREAGYPKSLVERAIGIICAEIMAMQANSRYFEVGSMADIILALKGNFGDEHVKKFEQILHSNMTGVQNMHRVPLIATPNGRGDVDVIQLKGNNKDMLFDVYIQKLTNLACAVFRMHPSEINEAARAGDNTGSLSQGSQNLQISMAQEQGLEAILMHEKTSFFDAILKRIDPDLVFEWELGKTEATQLEIVAKYASITTVDERRSMMGLEPLGPEKGGDVIDNSFVQAEKQAKKQEEQAKQQQEAMAAQQQQNQPPDDEDDSEEDDQDDQQQDDDGEITDDDFLREYQKQREE